VFVAGISVPDYLVYEPARLVDAPTDEVLNGSCGARGVPGRAGGAAWGAVGAHEGGCVKGCLDRTTTRCRRARAPQVADAGTAAASNAPSHGVRA
jgi:hypothetical protein